MKVIICPDSFKGSLSSIEAADAMARGVQLAVSPRQVDIVKIPLADGGEGTVEALVRAAGGEIRPVRVHDPLLREIDSFFGLLGDGKTAAVEMAAASGLCLLSDDERNPLVTSTYGTGELLLAAAEAGAQKIIVGIGGSATNDAGAGAMVALGARFLDKHGRDLPPGGAALADLARIDMSSFKFPVDRVEVEVACDVDNPLTGPNGASAIYGPQKGATPEMVNLLDATLRNYAQVVRQNLNKNVAQLPGGGAAGGLGAGLAAFLNANLRSGIDIVLDTVNFDAAVSGADLIITGEGRIDEQTAYGKTIGGILKRVAGHDIPVVAIAGSISGDIQPLCDAGLTAVFALTAESVSTDYAVENAARLLESISADIARLKL